jgi:hypothetical protein
VPSLAVGRFGLVIPAIYLGWSAAAVFLGEAARSRRSYLAGLVERGRFAEPLAAAAVWILVPLAIGVVRVSRTEVKST